MHAHIPTWVEQEEMKGCDFAGIEHEAAMEKVAV